MSLVQVYHYGGVCNKYTQSTTLESFKMINSDKISITRSVLDCGNGYYGFETGVQLSSDIVHLIAINQFGGGGNGQNGINWV